jgi:four helix bundle protein
MTYKGWETSVPDSIARDPLWTVEAYRLALFASELAWADIQKLRRQHLYRLADQLYSAVGGIGAQIAEGYSRRTGKDRARFYEYALGSGREARDWYYKSRHVLGPAVVDHRLKLHAGIIRLLMRMVPDQRAESVAESEADYGAEAWEEFLDTEVPL